MGKTQKIIMENELGLIRRDASIWDVYKFDSIIFHVKRTVMLYDRGCDNACERRTMIVRNVKILNRDKQTTGTTGCVVIDISILFKNESNEL